MPEFLTWLDWYVWGARANYLARVAGRPEILAKYHPASALEVCWLQALAMLGKQQSQETPPPAMVAPWETASDPGTAAATFAFYSAISLFTCPDADAVQADADLCRQVGINPNPAARPGCQDFASIGAGVCPCPRSANR